MRDLKSWIEAQLKRGYTRNQIKNALIRKGYPQTAVAEVDKIGYSALPAETLPSKKIPKKFSSKTIALIGLIVLVLVVVIIIAVNYAPQSLENQLSQKSSLQAGSPLCIAYPAIQGEISCDDAIALALKEANGTVQGISIAPTKLRSGIANLWLVDIKLATPYFDSRLQKEVTSLQIGIGMNESVGIYIKPLETR